MPTNNAPTLTARATAVVTSEKGHSRVLAEKVWPALDVMKTGQCHAWVTRHWNKLRPTIECNEMLRVSYVAKTNGYPHRHYEGGIRGTGRVVCREGSME